MFGGLNQLMVAGKRVEYNGESWVLISNTGMKTTDEESVFLAIRANDTFPAQTYAIPVSNKVPKPCEWPSNPDE